jgi:SRSO17 transposase
VTLQQFLGRSTRDEWMILRRYRRIMAGEFTDVVGFDEIDDSINPSRGKHSVGVRRQHRGTLSKKANRQCAISVHRIGAKGHYPLRYAAVPP